VREALETIPGDCDVEIAFFGGSFTGIDRGMMLDLLERAERFVKEGCVSSIRLSTRPDYITPEILEILSRYSVKTVELGLQSMRNRVLNASLRGHSAETARRACRMVREAGFSLVGQMMIGLPASSLEDELFTAEELCRIGVDAVRIYPTVVFYGTALCKMVEDGNYMPLTVSEAVRRSSSVLKLFLANGVPCIRIGLCAGEDFSSRDKVMAGPNQAALGEMVWNEIYYEKLLASLSAKGLLHRDVLLYLPERQISKYVGQHRCNLDKLRRETDTRIRKIVGKKKLDAPMPILWQRGASQREEETYPCI